MLERAAFYAHHDVLAYLLELGANPNDKADGGSSALDVCIKHLGWEDFSRKHGYGPRACPWRQGIQGARSHQGARQVRSHVEHRSFPHCTRRGGFSTDRNPR